MSKKPKQSGTQTVSTQGTLPPWLDSRYQNAAGSAEALFQSGGNPAVAQAQARLNAAQSRPTQSTPNGWRFDPSGTGVMAADGIHGAGGYKRRNDQGEWEWMDSQLAGTYGGRGGNSAELSSAQAALAAAQAQPWDQTQDPLYRHKTGFSAPTQMGMESMLDVASSGMGDNALNLWNQTLQGDFLHGGDAFNEAYGAAQRRITPQVTGAFNAAGRMGGGAGADELGGRLGDAFAGLYNAERGRQQGALSLSPVMSTLAYEPARRQMMVGALQDEKAMENRDIDYANANIDAQRLDQYLSRLGGIAPNFRGTKEERPIYSQGGGIGSLIGPALSVAGMFSGNPFAGMGALGGMGGGLGMGATGSMTIPGGGLLGGFEF